MRKTLIVPMVGLLVAFAALSYAADDAKVELEWTPPTNVIANDTCGEDGRVLTQDDYDRIEYTLSHREKQVTPGPWIPTETTDTIVTLDNLKWDTTYEAIVGAHWPGGAVFCPTGMLEFTTTTEPPPGTCTGFTATQVP